MMFSLFVKFVYVNSAFSPNPDESVNDLYNVSVFSSHPFVCISLFLVSLPIAYVVLVSVFAELWL